MGVIFLSGAYGVGKSTISRALFKSILIPTFSASKLIFEESGVDYKVNKEVENIDFNQRILLENVRNKLKLHNRMILVGHFALLNSCGEIENIPESLYMELGLEAIVLIEANPEKVIKRLQDRDKKEYDPILVEKLMVNEVSNAEYIANLLNIPLYKHCNNDSSVQIDGIVEFIGRLSF